MEEWRSGSERMPIRVTLVSPRSRTSSKSSVSVTSEFQFMNLPSVKTPRKGEPNR